MLEWVDYRARFSPEKVAYIEDGRSWTFIELQSLVARLARAIHDNGVQPGDRVGLIPKTTIRSTAAIFAIQRLGATPVLLNSRWSWTEIKHQTEAIECRQIYTDSTNIRFPPGAVIPLPDFADLIGSDQTIKQIPAGDLNLDAPCVILFTSGSSGSALGVELSFGNFFWNNVGTSIRLGSDPGDRWLACLPIYHVGGLSIIMRGLLNGLPVHLKDSFDPNDVLATLDKESITLVSLVPTMLHRLLKIGASKLVESNLRALLIGGGRLQQALLDECLMIGLPIALTYGMTEAASQIATANPDQVRKKPRSVGRPLFFNELVILDDAGKELGVNEIGEITLSGPTVMRGYLNSMDDASRKLVDGTLSTGDLGYRDLDGDLWIIGRQDGVINSGGEKIYPHEVEEALLQHPEVIEAHVFGVEDPEWGQMVSAAIVGAPNNRLYPDELIEYLRPTLGGYKIPRAIYLLDNFPRTGSGKIDLQAVQAQVKAKNGSK